MDQLLILATLCELLLQHYFYALHDSTWNHGNPPSIPLLFVRITEKKIDFSKNHKLQKISRATYSGLHRVTTLAYVIIRSLVTLFFLKFGVWGLISKRMGNDTYCGKNWIWFYIWLHVVLLDLNLIQSHISTNSWLGIELAKSDLKGCLAKLLFEGLWDLFKSLYWNVTFEHSTWHWFT